MDLTMAQFGSSIFRDCKQAKGKLSMHTSGDASAMFLFRFHDTASAWQRMYL
ncbi:hypothetical protein M3J09_009313 [Ascochyta lentis]